MSAPSDMCSNKSDLKDDVIRANFCNAIELIPKGRVVGKTSHFPRRQTARGTWIESVTVVLDDVALRFNAYVNVRVDEIGRGAFGTGKTLVDYVLAPVLEALEQYPRIHTYALVADAECFTTEAKEQTQAKRATSRRSQGEKNGIAPLDWNEDAPRPLSPYGGALAPLESVKLTRAALRHVIYETMQSIAETYVPPAGKRLILDFQEYGATNPTRPEDWMVSDAFEPVSDEAAATVARMRAELVELAARESANWRTALADHARLLRGWAHSASAAGVSTDQLVAALAATADADESNWIARLRSAEYAAERVAAEVQQERPSRADELSEKLSGALGSSPRHWRAQARQSARFVCRSGLVRKLPLCIETTRCGVRLAPFRLRNCANQGGEADLTIQAFAVWLFQGALRHALAGERRSGQLALYEAGGGEEAYGKAFMDAERAKAQNADEFKEIWLGERGHAEPQRCLLMSVDTDFVSYTTAHFGRQVADYCAHHKCTLAAAHADLLPHAPLLVLGEAHVTVTGAGVETTYGTSTQAKELGLQRVYEVLDIGTLFATLTQVAGDGYELTDEPIAHLARVASEKRAQGRKRSAATRERKRKFGAEAAPAPVDDETCDWATIELPHLPADVAPARVYERVLDFVVFCNMCGNDFLGGLPYISRRSAFAGFAEMLFREPDRQLVRCHVRGPLPSAGVVTLCPSTYVCLIKYVYYAQMSKDGNKTLPASSVAETTFAAMAAAMRTLGKQERHMPDERRLHVMYERLLFSLYYIVHGPFNVAQTLDPLKIGWAPDVRDTEV